jgi:anti-sigma factor RsiW
MHEHVTDDLLAYVENRLDERRRAQLEVHLESCDVCRGRAAATREVGGALADAGRLARHMPVSTWKGWAAVRQRWQAPIATRVQEASRRLSWQVAVSLAVVAMAFLSGVSLTAVQAATPNVPSIETPGTQVSLSSDTPTLSATRSSLAQTPTLTLTPIPIVTN